METLRDPALGKFTQLSMGKLKAPSLAKLQNDLSTLSPEQIEITRRCVQD